MSILTKIFVVLVMVLSVLLVALVVPFVVNTDTYKAKWQQARAEKIIAQANASNREADLAAKIQSFEQQRSNLQDQISRLQSQLNERNSTIENQQGQLIELQNANEDVRGQLAQLSTGLKQATQINSMLQEEVRTRREQMLELQTRNVELNDKLRETKTQVETLTRQVRLLKEKNQDLASRNEELTDKLESARVAAGPGEGKGPMRLAGTAEFEPETAIRGSVTDVRKAGEETFIALNIGGNDNVEQGMRFMIHRGDRFLGNAVVTKVDANSAAARVTLQRGEITTDAEVLAGGG